jgi:hypothetical protein
MAMNLSPTESILPRIDSQVNGSTNLNTDWHVVPRTAPHTYCDLELDTYWIKEPRGNPWVKRRRNGMPGLTLNESKGDGIRSSRNLRSKLGMSIWEKVVSAVITALGFTFHTRMT